MSAFPDQRRLTSAGLGVAHRRTVTGGEGVPLTRVERKRETPIGVVLEVLIVVLLVVWLLGGVVPPLGWRSGGNPRE